MPPNEGILWLIPHLSPLSSPNFPLRQTSQIYILHDGGSNRVSWDLGAGRCDDRGPSANFLLGRRRQQHEFNSPDNAGHTRPYYRPVCERCCPDK